MSFKVDSNNVEKVIEELNFSKSNGLIAVIAQDWQTNEVLMFAFANKEAILKSLATGRAHYYSRTRKELWEKGESSGHVQIIKEIFVDCDADAILLKIEQNVAACHEGYKSCFFRKLNDKGEFKIIGKKIFNPSEVY
ncbi:MAG TPA: phosphoribosyl-AMP cyclohydrolase [Candidatus Deferrimicrobium sp.]|nr:phosphoribosyl-AMP cyclohydrolase [Candidatus Deferrimicrobium sp.]